MESLNQSLNTSLHIDCEQLDLLMGLKLEEQEVKGMENSSNNCYIIAIIQCTRTLNMHVNSLYEFLTHKNEQLLEIIDGNSASIHLYNFVVSYCHLVLSNDHDEHLPTFIKSLSKITPNFPLNVQHDSNEVWLFITEQIDKRIQLMNNEQVPIIDKNPNDFKCSN
jgi:ubiquitin C-terminal hydrolase